jgi:hypothetical protein
MALRFSRFVSSGLPKSLPKSLPKNALKWSGAFTPIYHSINHSINHREFSSKNKSDISVSSDQLNDIKKQFLEYDRLVVLSQLESINELLDAFELAAAKDPSEQLAERLPKETQQFFIDYLNEILNALTKNLPKNSQKEMLLKEEISRKIPLVVSVGFNELLKCMHIFSTRDETKAFVERYKKEFSTRYPQTKVIKNN